MSARPRPAHAPHPFFHAAGEMLEVAGRPLAAIAEEVGTTPFYVYSRAAMSARASALRAAMPPGLHLHYAVKANPMPAVVDHMAGLVDGLDVASAGELRVALDSGKAAAHVSFAGPGKRDGELEAAIAAGITINVESAGELERIARIAACEGSRPRVAVRVNPDFQLKTSGMKMGGGPQQFGIDAECVPEVLQRITQLDVDFAGFHIFGGSQNLRAEAIIEAQARTVDLALRLAADAPGPVHSLNIGGGFGIPYFPGETPLDLAPIGEALAERLALLSAHMPGARVILELGRFLVGEAGLYVCRVVDRKISRGRVFLVTDGGLHHHLAASGNFGQVVRKNYPVAIANRMGREPLEVASVVGPLCTPLDLLADQMPMPRAEPGDLVAVFQSGAYGLTASPTAFLGHPPPAEALV